MKLFNINIVKIISANRNFKDQGPEMQFSLNHSLDDTLMKIKTVRVYKVYTTLHLKRFLLQNLNSSHTMKHRERFTFVPKFFKPPLLIYNCSKTNNSNSKVLTEKG